VLATGPKVRWFKPGQGNTFLRAITISNTPFSEYEVKQETSRRKILRHVKEIYEYERNIS
jgi:hypothetical protein